jgi:hypothetical protein
VYLERVNGESEGGAWLEISVPDHGLGYGQPKPLTFAIVSDSGATSTVTFGSSYPQLIELEEKVVAAIEAARTPS